MPHVTVCICTYQRPAFLRRLLKAIQRQDLKGLLRASIVVADNDHEESARGVVEELESNPYFEVRYGVEARKNIAQARNCAISLASGEFIAFIDDDEFPADDWLLKLWQTCQEYEVAGVLGPVRPHFEQQPPEWIIKGGFCERPEYATGRVMHWEECRTGNVLFRRSIILNSPVPFDPQFGTGGEDNDFFLRFSRQGAVFVWCNEAVVYETVPPERWKRAYMLRRALLRGKQILKFPTGKVALLATSLAAAPMYALALPFASLLGQHRFMNYAIRFCDHVGRLLAFVRLNWINDR